MAKVAKFEAMARSMVGDGKSPNLYFIGIDGTIVCITSNGVAAREMVGVGYGPGAIFHGRVTVEDRKHGVLFDSAEGRHWEE